VFGSASLDIVSLALADGEDINRQTFVFQIIGIDCYMNDFVASALCFQFLAKGGGRQAREQSTAKHFLYCPFICSEGLSRAKFSTFFRESKHENVTYNIDLGSGQTFLLVDSLQSGVISCVVIGKPGDPLYLSLDAGGSPYVHARAPSVRQEGGKQMPRFLAATEVLRDQGEVSLFSTCFTNRSEILSLRQLYYIFHRKLQVLRLERQSSLGR